METKMTEFESFFQAMAKGRSWELMGDSKPVREFLWRVYDERFHKGKHYKDRYQIRVNLQDKDDSASYAGWITSENPESGPYQGTSFVWMPGQGGSVAVLVIGTDGFGADTAILGRPGHGRRLRALSRLHRGHIWVKPDLLDIATKIPEAVTNTWPEIPAALKSYSHVIYAAVAVRPDSDPAAVEDLLDLFFFEHQTPLTGISQKRWETRQQDIAARIFPKVSEDEFLSLLRERRFAILEGPPGTGKTRLAYQIAKKICTKPTMIQFHAARTYEDFVVGLFPKPTASGLKFEARAGDFLKANEKAKDNEHILVIDEINRADLARVLGEAVVLLESGEMARSVVLPHTPAGYPENLELSPHLLILGTRNTADRTIARMDIAIRRRFAFIQMWPNLDAVRQEGIDFATDLFTDTIQTFAEYADEDTLFLVPGHAYFLDPRPDLSPEGRPGRVRHRIHFELIPLLRMYLEEKMCGPASEAIAGLTDRIEGRLLGLE
jgi:5-methylcytosine-specific restriction enzyme B